jgi:hypothetical protein
MAWPVVEEDIIDSQKLMNFGVGFNEGGKKGAREKVPPWIHASPA